MSTTRTLITTASDKRLSLPISTHNDAIVAFHELCDSCERFFRSWDVIDTVQSSSSLQNHASEPSFFSSVAHLIQADRSCHCCKLLLRALELFPNKSVKSRGDEHVYVRAVQSEDCVVLQASLSSSTPPKDDERKPGAAFCLRKFTRKNTSSIAQGCCN
jgi:hypothetical protein